MELIFDFDGTLADRCGCSPSWLFRLARSHGYRGAEEDALVALGGCTDFDAAARLEIEDRQDEFTARLIAHNRRCLGRAFWHPKQAAVLTRLASRHELLVLSNRDQRSLDEGLHRLGCAGLFRDCIGSTPEIAGKPETALYQRLRERVPPSSDVSIYVGDKPIDREFARRAGLGFIAACWYRDVLRDDDSSCAELEQLPDRVERMQATFVPIC